MNMYRNISGGRDEAIYDTSYGGYRVFMGDISSRASRRDLEKEFDYYGTILDCWIARNSPICFAVFKHSRDAEKCVDDLDGRDVGNRRVRVEHARPFGPRRGGRVPTPPRIRYRSSRSRSRARRRRRRDSHSRSRSGSRGKDKDDDKGHSRSRSPRSRSRGRSEDRKDSRSKSRSPARDGSEDKDKDRRENGGDD